MTADERLPAGLVPLLAGYIVKQRWYAGPDDLPAGGVELAGGAELAGGDGGRHLYHLLVDAAGARYQLLVGRRPAGEPADFLSGREDAVIGGLGDSYVYDAVLDADLARELLGIITSGAETAERVRPVSAEQSNTSLVFDDRVIAKLYRRLADGPNPDVEVTTALAGVGFGQIAEPVGLWRQDGVDLAFAQRFLAGGTEGWTLALTSLRDFYQAEVGEPEAAGGDFSLEARRLGQVTAQLHAAMGEAFGVGEVGAGSWERLVDSIEERLSRFVAGAGASGADGRGGAAGAGGADGEARADGEAGGQAEPGAEVPDPGTPAPGGAPAAGTAVPGTTRATDADAAAPSAGSAAVAVSALRAIAGPGPTRRVHGDYHLGQVMRADGGWYILDFEGEPARPVEERTRPASPLKDVAGMLRSFDYASRFALVERGGAAGDDSPAADAWARHNCDAFLAGYLAEAAGGSLPPADRLAAVLAAYELDKALYELDYENAYRPAWAPIPAAAISRIVRRLAG